MSVRVLLIAALAIVLGQAALAEGSRLQRLGERHELLGWEAVGRVDIGRRGYCTGVLIAPELVLTAAHCVYNEKDGLRAPAELTFRAGLHDGRFVASRTVRRLVAHRGYAPGRKVEAENILHDVALLELETPIPSSTAAPFALHIGSAAGDRVSVVSYGQGRDDAPSWQRDCGVLEHSGGLMAFDCNVTHGSSGSPVFVRDGSRARILSLISAASFDDKETVAFGMELPGLVADLKADLRRKPDDATGAAAPKAGASVRRIQVGSGNRTGAKFVRP